MGTITRPCVCVTRSSSRASSRGRSVESRGACRRAQPRLLPPGLCRRAASRRPTAATAMVFPSFQGRRNEPSAVALSVRCHAARPRQLAFSGRSASSAEETRKNETDVPRRPGCVPSGGGHSRPSAVSARLRVDAADHVQQRRLAAARRPGPRCATALPPARLETANPAAG